MNFRFFVAGKTWFAVLFFLASCGGNVMQTTVFTDGFQSLETGLSPSVSTGLPAIYFDSGRGKIGAWQVAASLRQPEFHGAWEIRREGEANYLAQTFSNLSDRNTPRSLITHPMVVGGDSLWKDCTIEVEFSPLAKFDKCGVVFKYRNPTDFFFVGIEGNTVTLKQVMQPVTPLRPVERTLDSRPHVWNPGERMDVTITLRRNKVFAILNDSIILHAENMPNQSGRIGLISDLPARFHRVEVKLLKGEQRKLARKKRQIQRRKEVLLGEHPAMVRWKAFETAGFGTNQNLRLGDLTGDGNKELLFVRPAEGQMNISCLTAMNLDGEILWQYGRQDQPISSEGPEVPVQIHDLDGDGEREVIYIQSGEIHVLSGRRGELVHTAILPENMVIRTMVFADLLGTGKDNCMVLSDRKNTLMVFDSQLELMWSRELTSASQPLIYDLDRDGKSEILIGYSVFDNAGVLKFDVGAFIGDECNGITMHEMKVGDRTIPSLVYAAGDWGLLYFDFNGNLLKQNVMGHVQYVGVGNFDAGMMGLELVTSNYWGSDGLIHLIDSTGEVRSNFMPQNGQSRCQPVNWKGDGEEFIITSAESASGGMFTAAGRLSVAFPDDGHPQQCYFALDLTGDARDELIVWDPDQLWIYTQDDNPRMGNTYAPQRIPLHNYSMHQMHRSVPGW
jgi:hypothetical protein